MLFHQVTYHVLVDSGSLIGLGSYDILYYVYVLKIKNGVLTTLLCSNSDPKIPYFDLSFRRYLDG